MYVLCSILHILRHIFLVTNFKQITLFKNQDLIQTFQVKNDAPFFEVHNSYHYGWVQTNLFVSNDRVS